MKIFLLAIKTAGSAQKFRVGRVSGNTAIFCLRLTSVKEAVLSIDTASPSLLSNMPRDACERIKVKNLK